VPWRDGQSRLADKARDDKPRARLNSTSMSGCSICSIFSRRLLLRGRLRIRFHPSRRAAQCCATQEVSLKGRDVEVVVAGPAELGRDLSSTQAPSGRA